MKNETAALRKQTKNYDNIIIDLINKSEGTE